MDTNGNYIQNQFCSYDIALKLKELGFNEECLAIYINLVLKPVIQKPISGEFNYKFKSVRNSVIVNSENCSAPLWQQAIDWLREKHDIHISLESYNQDENGNDIEYQYTYRIVTKKFFISNYKFLNIFYNSYKEAREQAILKAIELCEKS